MGILVAIITVSVVLIVIATAFPIVWPMVTAASSNITAMTGTDAGTTTVQGFWPLILLVVGIGIAIGLIMYGLKRFQIISKS